MDAGSGNPRYDELMREIESRGAKMPAIGNSSPKVEVPEDEDVPKKEERPSKSRRR